MRGGGGGGGQGGGGDSLRLEQQPCVASRKLVLGLKGILADRMELEIYSMLLDCTMAPTLPSSTSSHKVLSLLAPAAAPCLICPLPGSLKFEYMMWHGGS
jgi:hypothetical protein